MAIQIKRQGGGATSTAAAASPSSLNYGELACASNGDLYVGNGSRKPVGVVTTNGNKNISGTMRFSNSTTFYSSVNFRGGNVFTGASTFSNSVKFSSSVNFASSASFQTISVSDNINFSNVSNGQKGLYGVIGDDDAWRIQGGASAVNAGYLEIATADDGNEPSYVRQYLYGKVDAKGKYQFCKIL